MYDSRGCPQGSTFEAACGILGAQDMYIAVKAIRVSCFLFNGVNSLF